MIDPKSKFDVEQVHYRGFKITIYGGHLHYMDFKTVYGARIDAVSEEAKVILEEDADETLYYPMYVGNIPFLRESAFEWIDSFYEEGY